MKYFSVSTTGIVCSLVPLIACVFAAVILREQLTSWTVVSVCIVLSCVMFILLGAEGAEKEAMEQNTFAIIALCMQPLLLAGGVIATRKIKKNHPLAITCYSNVLLATASVLGIWFDSDLNFDFVSELVPISWLFIIIAGLFTIFENTAKFMAFRYEEAAKLQKLAFLQNVWNYLVDSMIVHKDFSGMQQGGYISLFAFYIFELVTFYWLGGSPFETRQLQPSETDQQKLLLK